MVRVALAASAGTAQPQVGVLPSAVKVGDPGAQLFAADAYERAAAMPSGGARQSLFYSLYKHNHTHKFQLVVSLGGWVVFASDAYAGGANDNDLFDREWPNILKVVPRGSTIYVDKVCSCGQNGPHHDEFSAPLPPCCLPPLFHLHTLLSQGYHTGRLVSRGLAAGITITVPPRKIKDRSFTSLQLQETQKTANLRVVVENIIGVCSQRWRWVRNGRHSVYVTDLVSAANRVCFYLDNCFPPRVQGDTQPMTHASAGGDSD